MNKISQKSFTVGSVLDLQTLKSLSVEKICDECEILELRLDGIIKEPEDKQQALELADEISNFIPILITCRWMGEGGKGMTNHEGRSRFLSDFLPFASLVDIEMTNLDAMEDIAYKVKYANKKLILSYHNFERTPEDSFLTKMINRGYAIGADVVKLAMQHTEIRDMRRCSDLFRLFPNKELSIMGMGDLAPVSRLLYAQCGSILNYGYLGETESAPGQWHAKQVKDCIANLSTWKF